MPYPSQVGAGIGRILKTEQEESMGVTAAEVSFGTLPALRKDDSEKTTLQTTSLPSSVSGDFGTVFQLHL